jgi:hypothetical protein
LKAVKPIRDRLDVKIGVLFLHHTCDSVTINNLNSIVKNNPGITVNTMGASEAISGGYSLNDTPRLKELHSEMPKRREDLLVCSWFLQKKHKCDKWWIVEWDLYCEIPIQHFYSQVWDYDFVASSVCLPYREPNWYWFRSLRDLPSDYKPFAMGALPFVFLMSERALESTCRMLIENPFFIGNSELRFATAANRSGYPPCGFSPPGDKITWIPWKRIDGPKSISHPVKHYVDYR